MLKVGLTGSIAVGKSFVCSILREHGCHVLDADLTAREVVAKGSDGLKSVVRVFGDDVLTESGDLDRKKMGSIVFADETKRRSLNSIIHPLVLESQDRWIKAVESNDPDGIAIIDAALMIESGGYKRFNKIIVVWCEPAIQLKRLMLRDGLSETDAKIRIGAQMPQEEKKLLASFLINTTDGFDAARTQTAEIINRLRMMRT